jgi:hypothetical protein
MAANTSSWPPGNEGEVRMWTSGARGGRGGNPTYYIYRSGEGWKSTTGPDSNKARDTFLEQSGGSMSYKSISTPGTQSTALRYPENIRYASGGDYVLFEFYEYQPPFQGINRAETVSGSKPTAVYNQSVQDEQFYKKTSQRSVVLYMPEDISTGYKANWSGKAFSNIGRDALITAGSGNLGDALTNAANTINDGIGTQLIPMSGAKLVSEAISKVTGEQMSNDDIFGATRGVILNPNVELLFGGTDLRNFQLNYKLVPRNQPEANTIKEIIKVFKKAMLPKFSSGTEFNLVKGQNVANNFIRVPNFCRVSFMKGGQINTNVTQYKMCAITQVDINYTPDGAYATYNDGSMVAIQLSLAFQESKLIFSEEADDY